MLTTYSNIANYIIFSVHFRKLTALILFYLPIVSFQSLGSTLTNCDDILTLSRATNTVNSAQLDSLEVIGKFIRPCFIPKSLKIREFNVMGSVYTEIPVNVQGEFNYRFVLTEPKQMTIRIGSGTFDFLATTNEKIYNLEVYCDSGVKDTVIIKNSYENNAFEPLFYLSKGLKNNLEKFENSNLADKDTFKLVKKLLKDYQDKVADIAKISSKSFTSSVLCPSEILPARSLVSIDALKQNYLNRDVFSNPFYYNTSLLSRTMINYLSILDKTDTSFVGFRNILSLSMVNQDCAKRLQQVLYDLLYYRQREQLIIKYQEWANSHSAELYNLGVRAQLRNLESCIKGAPCPEIRLNDPEGNLRKLSETIVSSKLTLLIFYSPTCGHCRESLPKLLPIWDKYRSKGMKIYTVGYDGTIDQWKDFIKSVSITEWTNVFEYENGSHPTSKFVVSTTPTFILINQQGKIITRFAELNDVLKLIPENLN